MLRLISIAALAACASAAADGPVFTTKDGELNLRVKRATDLRVTRDIEQTAALFDVQTDVQTLTSDMTTVKAFVEGFSFAGGAIGTSIGRIDALVQTAADNKATLESQSTTLDGKISDLKAEVATSLDDADTDLKAQLAAMAAENEALKVKLASDGTAQAAAVTKALAEAATATDVKVAALTQKLEEMKPKPLSLFVGGVSGSHRRSGTHDFTPSRVDFDSLAPWAKREGRGFTVLQDGVFEFQMRALTHGGWCHHHIRIYINDKAVHGASHDYVPGTWQQIDTTEIYTMKAGQKLHATLSGCNYAFHGSSQNEKSPHNKMSFRYIGQVSEACSGPFCKSWV